MNVALDSESLAPELSLRQRYKIAALAVVADYDLYSTSYFYHGVDVPTHADLCKAAAAFAAQIANEMIAEDLLHARMKAGAVKGGFITYPKTGDAPQVPYPVVGP